VSLSELPLFMQIASVWRERKTRRVDAVILRVLQTWGPITAGEVSG